MTPLEERLKRIADKLDAQAGDLADVEKADTPSEDSRLRQIRRELSDLKKAMQITPATPSRAAPVVVMDVSKSGLPTEVQRAIEARLRNEISENALYHALGFGT
jgi:hypothetical protein